MRSLTTWLLGLGTLLLVSCQNDPTITEQTAAPSTVSGQQADDAQQAGQPASHAPPQHAPDARTDPPQETNHHHPEPAGSPVTRISIGDPVPDFKVTINDKKWTLSQLRKNTELTRDGTIVLTFWCSFCHSCRHIDGNLNKLAEHYKGKVAIIALDASDGETTEEVTRFAKEKGLTLPIALNASGQAADILGTKVTTTTVVIDKQGILRYRGHFGNAQHPYARDALEAVLSGQTVKVTETKQRG